MQNKVPAAPPAAPVAPAPPAAPLLPPVADIPPANKKNIFMSCSVFGGQLTQLNSLTCHSMIS